MVDLIYHKNKCISIAESWTELKPVQYLQLVKLLHSGTIGSMVDAADKALYILSGKTLLSFLLVDPVARLRMHPHVQWIFEQKKIVQQLLPSYRNGLFGKKLYGPESEFDNILMAEFHHTELAFYNIANNPEQEEDAINELVAILYRPRKPKPYDIKRNKEGDVRIPFHYAEVVWNKKIVAKWPMHVKAGIVMWYDGCRQLLRELYPQAFSQKSSNSRNYFDGLFETMRSIAGTRYGDFDKVEHMNVHTAFREIAAGMKEAAEMEQHSKQQ